MAGGARIEAALWLVAALAFAGASWPSAPPTKSDAKAALREHGTLAVMTWNVGGTRDGRAHPFDRTDLPKVVQAIETIDSDLLLLQEFRYSTDWAALRAGLSDLRREGDPWIKASGDVAIVAFRGELHGGELTGNAALCQWTVDGRTIEVGNVHAPAWNARERRRAIGNVADRLLATPGPSRIFGGDLNLDVSQRSDLFSNDPDSDVAIYNWLAERLTDLGLKAGPTAEPDRRLDYLFASADLAPFHALVLEGFRGPTMDHDPLLVTLRFR
ncbi:MAG: endonuclease/exonuclease/phosphatase family protein [Planctomycetes bacterium]|nr:endonuclease/exonuclease/phosphatase family protein [Planctomycetota bacterium]